MLSGEQLAYQWYLMRKNPLTLAGLVIIVVVCVAALLAPVVSPYDPDAIDWGVRLVGPGRGHLFGTDDVGRDIFSRVLWGARLSVGVGLMIVMLSLVVGLVIGSIAGYWGGMMDTVIMRLMDMILAFPSLILAMALSAALGPNLRNAMLAIAVVRIPIYVRLVRSQALGVREREYVRAARAFGARPVWIIVRHILPNTIAPVLVQSTLDIGGAILTAAALSFLGLGAQQPTAEWGAMVSAGRRFILDQWWYATFPGAAIFVTAIGFNLFGDGLRDILDPRQRR
ncbi:MAG: ABC transporter permease subunit [Bacillota bacterium]|nr:ABC transporter permease subunit [Bacillota bacterium]